MGHLMADNEKEHFAFQFTDQKKKEKRKAMTISQPTSYLEHVQLNLLPIYKAVWLATSDLAISLKPEAIMNVNKNRFCYS